MTRGRAWIAVLGVLLVGIVALNVATLSFAASSGKIDEQITALEKENSMLESREAQNFSTAQVRSKGAELGLAMPTTEEPRRDRVRARRRRHRGRPPRGRRGLRAAADALGRAPDRPSLRRFPPLLPPHRRPRLLAAGGAGVEPRLAGGLPADRGRHRSRPARRPARPQRQQARRLRRRGDDLRHALPGEEPAAGRGAAGADPQAAEGRGAGSADRRRRLLLRRPESRPRHRRQGRTPSTWKGSGNCPTAAAPTRRGRWRAR